MRYKLTLEYDGTNTLGWQRQLDGPSIQEYLEKVLLSNGVEYVYLEKHTVKNTVCDCKYDN